MWLFICLCVYLSPVWGQSWRRDIKCDCKIDWLWVRSTLEEMKYLFTFLFSFLCCSVEAKGGVEIRHSTRNASGKWETECFKTRFPLPTLLCAGQREADLIFFLLKYSPLSAEFWRNCLLSFFLYYKINKI